MYQPIFDFAQVSPRCRIAIVGPRCSGKTTLLEDLLFHQKDLSFCLEFSTPNELCGPFGKPMPNSWKKGIEFVSSSMNTLEGNRVGIVTDDCFGFDAFDVNALEKTTCNKNILRIDCIQELLNVPQNIRCKYDLVFFLPPHKGNNGLFWRSFASEILPDYEEFQHFIRYCGPQEAVVLDLCNHTISFHKVKQHNPFTIGCNQDSWDTYAINVY